MGRLGACLKTDESAAKAIIKTYAGGPFNIISPTLTPMSLATIGHLAINRKNTGADVSDSASKFPWPLLITILEG